jgi:hypothetical protein
LNARDDSTAHEIGILKIRQCFLKFYSHLINNVDNEILHAQKNYLEALKESTFIRTPVKELSLSRKSAAKLKATPLTDVKKGKRISNLIAKKQQKKKTMMRYSGSQHTLDSKIKHMFLTAKISECKHFYLLKGF